MKQPSFINPIRNMHGNHGYLAIMVYKIEISADGRLANAFAVNCG